MDCIYKYVCRKIIYWIILAWLICKIWFGYYILWFGIIDYYFIFRYKNNKEGDIGLNINNNRNNVFA